MCRCEMRGWFVRVDYHSIRFFKKCVRAAFEQSRVFSTHRVRTGYDSVTCVRVCVCVCYCLWRQVGVLATIDCGRKSGLTLAGGDLNLDGGVAAGVKDLSGVDLGDGHGELN